MNQKRGILMELLSLTVGRLQENVYFLIDENKETLIFDPGAQAEDIKELIEEEGLKPIAIVLTHAHGDHIGAVDELRKAYNIPMYMNEIEKEFLTNTDFNRSLYSNENITVDPADGYYPAELGKWKIGNFEPELALIPGHSPGSTVFIFKDNGFVIGGDVLFKGSVGRSDFSYGSHMTLMAGIEQYLLPLPGNTVVFPGHGEPTTLQDEIASNPFLNGATR